MLATGQLYQAGIAAGLDSIPSDPLLGLMSLYEADTCSRKVDLGVGVYKDENGRAPIPSAVKRAEALLLEREGSKSYTTPLGDLPFIEALRDLVFGEELCEVEKSSFTGIQTPGASGALRIATEFIARCRPGCELWLPTPTWVNHDPLMSQSGLVLRNYPYYDRSRNLLDFDSIVDTLKVIPPSAVVLLHGCCHNPSGADLTPAQWQNIGEVAEQRGFTVLVDMAYQGFGQGLDADAIGIRLLSQRLPNLLATVSCSKNFGLYRDRVGAFFVKAETASAEAVCQSHMQDIVRGHYFVPPAHGSGVVRTILGDPELRAEWLSELESARERILALRQSVVAAARQTALGTEIDYLSDQRGMFSFLNLNNDQVRLLREQHSIYLADSGRINLTGLNASNLDYVLDALVKVRSESIVPAII